MGVTEEDAPNTEEALGGPFVKVTFLKATAGTMNYVIPPEVDVTKYKSVIIWCEITHNAYGAGSLQA